MSGHHQNSNSVNVTGISPFGVFNRYANGGGQAVNITSSSIYSDVRPSSFAPEFQAHILSGALISGNYSLKAGGYFDGYPSAYSIGGFTARFSIDQ